MSNAITDSITDSISDRISDPISGPNNGAVKTVEITKVCATAFQVHTDAISVEEPVEIRLSQTKEGENIVRQVAVTMRTPGEDRALAAGFLFTEGIISSPDDITAIESDKCNIVIVHVNDRVDIDPAIFDRHSFVASSCGVCGKKTIAAVRVKRQYTCRHEVPVVSPAVVRSFSSTLRSFQAEFERTGGLHASCLFDCRGKLLNIKEDVGRHNALDKVIGAELLDNALPLTDKILMVSGRASFELVQKAAHAGLAFIAAVGAPSSLAVQLAQECDMTLLGFVRDDRFNVYSGIQRIVSEPSG